jgi:hypothetical protein
LFECILPHYLDHLEKESSAAGNAPGAVKHEINAYTTYVHYMY